MAKIGSSICKHRTLTGRAAALIMVTGLSLAQCRATAAPVTTPPGAKQAVFAGGCFWCMEPPFEKKPGVYHVISGFAGGPEKNPSYQDVAYGKTGHIEAVQVVYDPTRVSYEELLSIFWRQIDPTDDGGQFADRGNQYRTAIFYSTEQEKTAAEKSKRDLTGLGKFSKPIVTRILPAAPFYAAEESHQDYYKKNPSHYKRYRRGSGREGFLQRIWGAAEDPPSKKHGALNRPYAKPPASELKKRLSSVQYDVTQNDGTEPPFRNAYWDNGREGIYLDVVSGEPLFSSTHKFKSGTGWPSFTQPLEPNHVVERDDHKLFMKRTEVRSRYGDSHLGHVFDDGPPPTGKRYCINSAALEFVPKADLHQRGLSRYLPLFSSP